MVRLYRTSESKDPFASGDGHDGRFIVDVYVNVDRGHSGVDRLVDLGAVQQGRDDTVAFRLGG
jgi:hypothetical protein